jgi:hypothetical protein
MFSQLLDRKESGETVSEEADEATLPADEPSEITAAKAEEE